MLKPASHVVPFRRPRRRYRQPPGKAHRNRPRRGLVKSYLRRTNPFMFALLYRDHALAQDWRELMIERDAMRDAAIVQCITCHALMIHAACGIFYCPYERAGVEDRAKAIFGDASPGIAPVAAGAELPPPMSPAAQAERPYRGDSRILRDWARRQVEGESGGT